MGQKGNATDVLGRLALKRRFKRNGLLRVGARLLFATIVFQLELQIRLTSPFHLVACQAMCKICSRKVSSTVFQCQPYYMNVLSEELSI